MVDKQFAQGAGVLDAPDLDTPAGTQAARTSPTRVTGVALGRLAALPALKRVLVTIRGQESLPPIEANCLATLQSDDVGREVALMFEDGDPARPLVIGLIELPPTIEVESLRAPSESLKLEAENLVFTAEKEVVLSCGKASITLTRAGKVLIRGTYLLNRSSGVNRIKGGSVQIN